MTDFAARLQPDRGQPAHAIHLVDKAGYDAWLRALPETQRLAAQAQSLKPTPGGTAILPGNRPDEWSAAAIVADAAALTPWCLARLAETLPEGSYRLADGAPGAAALGWLLAQHRFDRYRETPEPSVPRVLLTREPARIDETVRLADAVALVRDMVDTPAADMGPADIAAAVRDAAALGGASVLLVEGETLARDYPMIHAVGRAASPARQPLLAGLEWGDAAHPLVAIVGKGVCFDSGGLDIKPSAGMRLMKKDMGGAAHAIALARLVMQARLPVRLLLLVPAVENAISADAFRPGDVLRSRKGLSVEIGNTDAEGRLVLADALHHAAEAAPVLLIDFATLTGAARVALGPDLPALFANDEALAADLLAAGEAAGDPLWRLPLWQPYLDMLKSDIADVANAGDGGFAGSVTAALFLQKFVPADLPWAHLDTFAWMPVTKAGRPRGGEALGMRAAFEMLRRRFPCEKT